MRKRLIEPAVRHMRSPITMRAVAMFLALVFVTYIVVTDYQDRRISMERHEAISQNVEASKKAIVRAERQFEVYEQATKNTTALLDYLNETTAGMKEVSEVLKAERIERQKTATVTKRRRSKAKALAACYEMRERVEAHGNTQVLIRDLVNMKCQ